MFFGILFGREPLRIELPGAPADALRTLRASTPPSAWQTLFRRAIVGRVSEERIRLRYHRPVAWSSLPQRFVGRVTSDGGRPVLEGHFHTGWYQQLFLGLWLLLLGVLWIMVLLPSTQVVGSRTEAVGILTLLTVVGLGWLVLSAHQARADRVAMAEHLARALADRHARAPVGT